jgi:hypothetical protein
LLKNAQAGHLPSACSLALACAALTSNLLRACRACGGVKRFGRWLGCAICRTRRSSERTEIPQTAMPRGSKPGERRRGRQRATRQLRQPIPRRPHLQIRGYPPGERWPTSATVDESWVYIAYSYRRVAVMREHDLQAKRHRWTGMNCRGHCQRTEIHRTTPHFLQVVPASMPRDQAITQLKVSSAVALPSRWLSRELALERRQDHRS